MKKNLSSKIITGILLVFGLMFIPQIQLVAWDSGDWNGGIKPYPGELVPWPQYAIGATANLYNTALRIYVVKETGSTIEIVSNVKDFRKTDTEHANSVTYYSTSGNGLGTRWNNSYNYNASSSGYNAFMIEKNSFHGAALPVSKTGSSAAQVKNFFLSLKQNDSKCDPNCLYQFLVDDLGGISPENKKRFKDGGDVKNYFLIVEPVLYTRQSQWQKPSSAPAYIMQTALTPSDLGKHYQSPHFRSPTFQFMWNVGARHLNHLPNWIIYSGEQRMQSLKTPASSQILERCPSQSPLRTVTHCRNNPNQYFYGPEYLSGSWGIGIAYFWLEEFLGRDCDDPTSPDYPCDDEPPCDKPDGNPDTPPPDDGSYCDCGKLIDNLPDSYVYLVNWSLNKGSNGYNGKLDCCNDFKLFIDDLEVNDSANPNLQMYKADYEKYCKSPTVVINDCNYTVSVSCVDCVAPVGVGGIEDIENWKCIFLSDKIAPVVPPFRNHYIDQGPGLLNNPYCKVYCREKMSYVYPAQTFTVFAGTHFTVGASSVGNSNDLIPNWGEIKFQGDANCRPTVVRNMKDDPRGPIDSTKPGDHAELYIDHVLFTHDWVDLDKRIGDAWDKWQLAVLRDWIIDNAKFDGQKSSCGLVFHDSISGEPGCVKEEKIYFHPMCGESKKPFVCEWETTHTTGKPPKQITTTTKHKENADSRYDCRQMETSLYYERVRTPSYYYPKANIKANEISLGNKVNLAWCTDRSDINYSWKSSGSGGAEMRTVDIFGDGGPQSKLSKLRSGSTELYNQPKDTIPWDMLTNPSTSQRASDYHNLVAQRAILLGNINNCQRYEYDYNHLLPEMVVGYNDFKYPIPPDPQEFKLVPEIEETSEWEYFIKGGGIGSVSSTDDIKYFDCVGPTKPGAVANVSYNGRADKCAIDDQEYPNNDSFFHTKDRLIQYSLNDDIYRYVIKHTRRGDFERDSLSVHDRPGDGNFIDIGYPNLPVHYFQGTANPTIGEVWVRFDDTLTLGPNNKFDQFVFGSYKSHSEAPEECFKYECEYEIKYRMPPGPDPDPTDPNPGAGILVMFRPIDLLEPFPGADGTGRTPGYNWNDSQSITNIITNNRGVSDYQIYRGNPQYEIQLGFLEIMNVRNYNRSRAYNDTDTLVCEDGSTGRHRNCRSTFIGERDFIRRN